MTPGQVKLSRHSQRLVLIMSAGLPCIEIVSAASSNAYREDPSNISTIQPALNIIKNADGAIRIYHGLEAEEAKRAFGYIAWQTLEDHKKFQEDATEYPKLKQNLSNIWGAAPRVLHVQPTADPYPAFAAPVTELALLTLKPGESKDALVDILQKLTTRGTPGENGYITALYGTIVERDDMFALIAGWNSVEDHWKLVTTEPEAIALLTQMRQLVDVEVSHAALHEYK